MIVCLIYNAVYVGRINKQDNHSMNEEDNAVYNVCHTVLTGLV